MVYYSANPVMMIEPKRVIFFGTDACFSMTVFQCLIELGVTPCAVVVPEYPAAGNMPSLSDTGLDVISKKPLLSMAEAMNIPLLFAPNKNDLSLVCELKRCAAEFILVACWPYLLNEDICSSVSKAALNLHPSLLPRYRGPNPVEVQLRSGERQLGVSLHLLSPVFDAGDIIGQSRIEISGSELMVEAIEKQTARVGARLFVEAIEDYGSRLWRPCKQSITRLGSTL